MNWNHITLKAKFLIYTLTHGHHQQNCYFINYKTIFSIEIPMINPNIFHYHHLFTNKKIIVPLINTWPSMKPNSNIWPNCWKTFSSVMMNNCNQKFKRLYSSHDPRLRTQCIQVPIKPPQKMFNRINDQYLIVINLEEIEIQMARWIWQYYCYQN